MKKLIALIMVLALCISCVAVADTLTMGTNAFFAPYEFYNDNDEVVGIDAEIAYLVCQKMGYDLVIDGNMEFASLIPAVMEGKIDFIMAGMTVTEDRAKNVDFSDSYATGVQVIIVAEGSAITCADDLFAEGANNVIGVQEGTTGDLYATWDIEDEGLGTVTQFPNGILAIEALATGKVDCVILDKGPAEYYVSVKEGLVILDTEYTIENYAAAFAKDSELTAKFNAALAELIAEGKVQEIIDKYINSAE